MSNLYKNMTTLAPPRYSMFSLSHLSSYRTELMGLAAIGIICCHTHARGVEMPGWLWQLFSLGQLGVSIFFLLSGMGIWYSLQNISLIELWRAKKWYVKRYVKLFVPFLLIVVPCGSYAAITGGHSLWWFLLRISTIQFWINGEGAWFVSVLVVCYLLSPGWEWLLRKVRHRTLLSAAWFLAIFCFGHLFMKHAEESAFYFAGFWIAPYVKRGLRIPWISIVAASMAMYLACIIFAPLQGLPRVFFLLPVVVILPCIVFDFSRMKSINKGFRFMGNITLESYLLNTSLPIFGLSYLYVVLIGIPLAWIIHKISDFMTSKILK